MDDEIESNTVSEPSPPSSEWMELLQAAFDGVFPTDQKLEELIDRMEGMP